MKDYSDWKQRYKDFVDDNCKVQFGNLIKQIKKSSSNTKETVSYIPVYVNGNRIHQHFTLFPDKIIDGDSYSLAKIDGDEFKELFKEVFKNTNESIKLVSLEIPDMMESMMKKWKK